MSHTLPGLAVCQRLTAAISRSSRLEDICAAALIALGDGLQVQRSAIQLFDADGVLRIKASRGISDVWVRSVEGCAPWTRGQADALMVVIPDLTRDAPVVQPSPDVMPSGGAATAFVPLVTVDGVIGALLLGYDAPPTLSTEEQQLAAIIAAEVAFALERTATQLALSESENRLRFALDAANMGTWEWDIGAQQLRWSPTLEQIHDAAPGTFDGTFASFERDIHPDDKARVLASTQRAMTDGTPHDVEYRIVTPDGTIRWVEGKGRVQHDADGNPIRMSGICMNVTVRKEAELARLDALEQSRRLSQRLAAIVESSDDAIISADLGDVVTSWNRGAERMFNYTSAEAIGQPLTLTVPTELHPAHLDLMARVRRGESLAVETVRCRRDGSPLDIALTVSPLKDAAGRIVGASQIGRDISARKQHDAEFSDLHRRLTKLIDASARLLDSPDAESVRSATIAIAHELLPADAYAIWRADRPDGEWKAVKAEGVSSGFTSTIVLLPGAAVTAVLLTAPVWVDNVADSMPLLDHRRSMYLDEGIQSLLVCPMRLRGSTTGTLVFYYRTPHTFSAAEVQTAQALANLAAAAMMVAELYDEQRAQREAAEAANRQTAFLAKVGALLTQSLEFENALSSVVQLAVPEICDACAVHLVGQDGTLECLAEARVEPAPAVLQQPVSSPGLEDLRLADRVSEVVLIGRPVIQDTYMCVPLSSSGRVLGAMTFEYQQSGRSFQDRDLQFAQEVAARAATAVTNVHAYRRVHEANRLKDEFLATLSHELRTPLNAIVGYAQMLHLGLLEGERRARAVAVLSRNADALKQIIDDVLDVSRITAGKLRLNVQPVDLASIVLAAIATVQPAADAKQIVVTATLDPDVPAIAADSDRLQQVLWNLLSNAVKFTPSGGAVTVCLRQAARGVDIAVVDTGRGIDPSFLPHVFDRFRQGDSRFSREYGGLGLGLSIARELAELHGGHVSVSSEGVGCGASFTLHLPQGPAHQGVTATPALVTPPLPGAAVPRLRLDGIRVLAVDDEDDALQLMREMLESAGAHVLTASSAVRALEVLQTEGADVLITDIGMPQMDGFELLRAVRRTLEPPLNAIPAAALTAYARSEDRARALSSGFQMHIAKPVNPVELIVAVASLTRASAFDSA